jgi:hypothetical protein
MLNSDSNYVPARWQVVQAFSESSVWISKASYAIDTADNLVKFNKDGDTTGIDFTDEIGKWNTVALSAMKPYKNEHKVNQDSIPVG